MSRSRTILDLSISLDGYGAGPDISAENPLGDHGERLHDWMFAGATETGRRVQDEVFGSAGAVVMGRGVFDVGKPYWSPETFHRLPVFVVTHRAEEPITDPGGSTFTFAGGVEQAHGSARAAAGDRDVVVIGGPTIGRAFLAAGLLDELPAPRRPPAARDRHAAVRPPRWVPAVRGDAHGRGRGRDALPLLAGTGSRAVRWARLDSNQGTTDYESAALPLSYRPGG